MDKYKIFTVLLLFLSLMLLLVLLFGRKEVYVCYDGTVKDTEKQCPAVPPLTITEKEAKAAITDYTNSFARSRIGLIGTVIGEVTRQNSSWRSDVTYSNSRTNEFYELTFLIDGKTSAITCIEGCEFLKVNECCSCTNETAATPTT